MLGLRFYAEHVEEVRRMLEQVEAGLEQGPPSLLRHRRRAIGLGDPAEGLQHVENGEIGNRGAVRTALPFDVQHRLTGEALAEFEDQTRLADAGLTADPHDLALAADRGLEAAPQQLDLAMATDERRRAPCAAESGPLAARQDERAATRELLAVVLDELESSLEERGGGVADQDGVGYGALDQCVECAECHLLSLQVQLGGAVALTDEDLSGVDGNLDRRPRGTIPPVAREALLDRHRRVGRLARRLLGPIETEGGDDPRRTPPLDLAPEALDLVEQQLEHAAGLERRLRRGGGDQRRA